MFSWADRMLYSGRNGAEAPASRAASWGPPRAAVARSGMRYLLQSNPTLTGIFVDRSYARNQIIAAGYFQVGFAGRMGTEGGRRSSLTSSFLCCFWPGYIEHHSWHAVGICVISAAWVQPAQ